MTAPVADEPGPLVDLRAALRVARRIDDPVKQIGALFKVRAWALELRGELVSLDAELVSAIDQVRAEHPDAEAEHEARFRAAVSRRAPGHPRGPR